MIRQWTTSVLIVTWDEGLLLSWAEALWGETTGAPYYCPVFKQ